MDQPNSPVSTSEEFWRGFRRGLPIVVATAPFGVLFGALAVENGFSVGEAMLMSATVYAGASQMVGIELFGQNIAPWLIVVSIFAVNFRHVLYSAATGRRTQQWSPLSRAVAFFFLIDPQFAEIERRAEEGKPITLAWYAGVAFPVYLCWIADCGLGAIFGKLIPDAQAIGLDFLLPIYFLGMVMGFRARPLWLPVVLTSAIVSVLAERFIGSPWHVSIGALAGIALAVVFTPGDAPAHRVEDAAE